MSAAGSFGRSRAATPRSEIPPKTLSYEGPYKWLVAGSVMFGSFLAVMDNNVVNMAMPHMMGTFGVNLSSITWVATIYSISQIIIITMTGWWTTVLGRKRLFLLSLGIFAGGSILSANAQSFEMMLVFRAIQGIGGGALMPLAQAIIRETFPARQQGMAMAVYAMGVVLAPATGPVFGGWLTDNYGWPYIFYLNIPFAAAGALMVATFVKDPPYLRRGIKRIDWLGILLLGVGLAAMQIVLVRGQEENWFASTLITFGAIFTVIVLTALVVWELYVKEPIVNFRVLRNVRLCAGTIAGFVFGLTLFGSSFIFPQLFQRILGYTAFDAGLALFPRGAIMFLVLPIVGRIYNYVDPRLLIFIGLAIIIPGFLQMAHLSPEVAFWNLIPIMLILGLGRPLLFVTTNTVAFSTVSPEDMTSASSFTTLARRIGANIGYAVLATLVERRTAFHRMNLIPQISELNTAYHSYLSDLTSFLIRQQVEPSVAQAKAFSFIDKLVTKQANLMAYNDVALFMTITFVGLVPLFFMFPKKQKWQ